VITGNTNMIPLAKKLDALVGVRTVVDNITQTPYSFDSPPLFNILHHGSKSLKIGVDISNNGVTHRNRFYPPYPKRLLE
jgi:hypothetical protein